MSKNYLTVFLSCLWPGLGHIYIKKPIGILYFLIWFYPVSRFLQTFPFPTYVDPIRKVDYVIWFIISIFWATILIDVWRIAKKSSGVAVWFLIPCFIIIFVFFSFSLPFKWQFFRVDGKSAGNLHTHTACMDGTGTYEEIIKLAKAQKFDFIALTDHDFCPANAELCEKENRIFCLAGQEVTNERYHILAIGIKDFINSQASIREIVEQIHQKGGLAIAAHPLRKRNVISEEDLAHSGFDAMECGRQTWLENRLQYQWSKKYNIPCIYNSDAHELGTLRTIYNVCESKIKTPSDLKEALKENRCRQFRPLDVWISGFAQFLF